MNSSNAPPNGQPWQVWIIDDDLLARVVMTEALRNELGVGNVTTVEIASFHTALQAFTNPTAVDLILLDNFLFDGEGIDLLPHINDFSRASGIEPVPVMMVSANDDQSFLARCFSLGASDYVTKPFDAYLLGNKAHAMLLAKRNRDEIIRQKTQLEHLVAAREREEAMARFTYDFYLRQTRSITTGTWTHLETPNAFSGDLLLSARSPEGSAFFMLVDATGHDLSAAITLIPLIATFQRMVGKGFRLSHLLHDLNSRLVEDTPTDRFVAAIVLMLDPQAGVVRVWNGGMPSALAVNGHGEVVREFPSRHMSLGILSDDEFSAQTEVHPLDSGDWFFFFSDGLPEQVNQAGVSFGSQKLTAHLQATPAEALKAVVLAHTEFRQNVPLGDDLCCCAIAPDLVLPEFRLKLSSMPIADALKSLRGRDSFVWTCVVNGEQIATAKIPMLCSAFLESMAISHDLNERVFTIVTELFVNAVDHGVLKLDSSLKDGPDGFFRYMQERDLRLSKLNSTDQVSVSVMWESESSPQYLKISVLDTGVGFAECYKRDCNGLEPLYGRGLNLAASLASRIDVVAPGNSISAILEGPCDSPNAVASR